MAKGGSKKGSPFEREICSLLSRWWTDGESDSVFYRTSGSGGRATRRGKQGLQTVNHCGDVGASDPIGMPLMKLFAIELKRGYNTDTFHNVIDAPPPRRNSLPAAQAWEDWFAQAELSRRHAGAYGWLIIARRDKREAVAVIDWDSMSLLYQQDCIRPNDFGYRMHLWTPSARPAVMVRLWQFLEVIKPKHIIAVVKGLDRQS